VASQTLSRERDLGVLYTGAEDLVRQLRDRQRMAQLRESVWAQRARFTFDHHVDDLVDFFRKVRADRQ
jgi:hypothetical protein